MKTVWKYEIRGGLKTPVPLPDGAKVVHAGLDPTGAPCVWAEVDTEAKTKKTTFFLIGTGHEIPDKTTHLGSFIDGPFVWHVYSIIWSDHVK